MGQRTRKKQPSAWWRLVLIPLPFLLALPFIMDPCFSLVDDGVTLDIAHRMDTGTMRVKDSATGERYAAFWFIEKDFGRARPVYWWWQWFNYKLYGAASGAWHFGLGLSLAVLLQLVYELAKRTTESVIGGLIAGGLVAAFSPYAAVFWRLGLGETPLLLLLAISLLCLMHAYQLGPRVASRKEGVFWIYSAGAVVSLGLAYFVKETRVAMVPTSIVLALALWRRKADGRSKGLLIGYVVVNVVAATVLLIHVVPMLSTGVYSKEYRMDLPVWVFRLLAEYIGTMGTAWSALPVLALATFGVRLVWGWRRKEVLSETQRWQLVWLLGAVSNMVILAPWGGSTLIVPRYLLPCTFFGALFIGSEIAWLLAEARRLLIEWARAPEKYEGARLFVRGAVVFVIALLGLVGVVNVVLTLGAVTKTHQRESANAHLVRFLAAEAPRGEPIYANIVKDEEEETRYEIRLHLRLIYQREDFDTDWRVKYFGDPEALGVAEARYKFFGLPRRGQWVFMPLGDRYRFSIFEQIRLMHEGMLPTRAVVIDAAGVHEPSDANELLKHVATTRYGWIVFETGRDVAAMMESSEP